MACAVIQPSSVDSSKATPTLVLDATENRILRAGVGESELKFRTTNVINQCVVRNRSAIASKSEPMQPLIPNFKQFLAFLIACDIHEVRSILMQEEGKLLHVFIVVDKYDFDLNERIYDKEEHIIDVFSQVDFDFHITCQHSVSDQSLTKVW